MSYQHHRTINVFVCDAPSVCDIMYRWPMSNRRKRASTSNFCSLPHEPAGRIASDSAFCSRSAEATIIHLLMHVPGQFSRNVVVVPKPIWDDWRIKREKIML
jgi:hypothetical protein